MKKYLLIFLMLFLSVSTFVQVNAEEEVVRGLVMSNIDETWKESCNKLTVFFNSDIKSVTLTINPGVTVESLNVIVYDKSSNIIFKPPKINIYNRGTITSISVSVRKNTTVTENEGTMGVLENDGQVTVSGGEVTTLNNHSSGTATVAGGTITRLNNYGQVTVSGGEVETLENSTETLGGTGGTVTVTGGEITTLNNGSNSKGTIGGAVTISGGIVTTVNNNTKDNTEGGKTIYASVTVNGGTVTKVNNSNSTLILNGKGVVTTVAGASSGTANIYSGTVTNKIDGFTGKINIDGGSLNGGIDNICGQVTVRGGTVESLGVNVEKGTINIGGGTVKNLHNKAYIISGCIKSLNIGDKDNNKGEVVVKKGIIVELNSITINNKKLNDASLTSEITSRISFQSGATAANTIVTCKGEDKTLFDILSSKFKNNATILYTGKGQTTMQSTTDSVFEISDTTITIPDGVNIKKMKLSDRSGKTREKVTIFNHGQIENYLEVNGRTDAVINNMLDEGGVTEKALKNVNRIGAINIKSGYSGNNTSATVYCESGSGYNSIGSINSNSGAGTFRFCNGTSVKGTISGHSASTVFEGSSSFEGNASIGTINFNSSGTFNMTSGTLSDLVSSGEGTAIVDGGRITGTLSNAKGTVEIKKGTVTTLNSNSTNEVKVNGGEVTTFNNNSSGKLTIGNGTVTALNNNVNGEVIISNGTITTFNNNSGKVTISNGKITAFNNDSGEVATSAGKIIAFNNFSKTKTVTIGGGTVTTFNGNAGSKVSFTGGTITNLTLKSGSTAEISNKDTIINELIGESGSEVIVNKPFAVNEGNIDKLKFNTGGEIIINAGIMIVLNEVQYTNNGKGESITVDKVNTYVNIKNPEGGQVNAMICCKKSDVYEVFKKYNNNKSKEDKVKFTLLGFCTDSTTAGGFKDIEEKDKEDDCISIGIYVPSGTIVSLNEKVFSAAVVAKGGVLQIVDDLTSFEEVVSEGDTIISAGVVGNLTVKSGGSVKVSGGKVTNIVVEKNGNLNISSRNSNVLGDMDVKGNVDFNGGRVKLNETHRDGCTCIHSGGRCKCCCDSCKGTGECATCNNKKTCTACNGTGTCADCNGTKQCKDCNGQVNGCETCAGTGTCTACNGTGTCADCNGTKQCKACKGDGKCKNCGDCECSVLGECLNNTIKIGLGGTMNVNSGNIEVPIKIYGGELAINGGRISNHILIDNEDGTDDPTGLKKKGKLTISSCQLGMSTSSLDIRNGEVTIENSTIDLKKDNSLILSKANSKLNLKNVNINSEGTAVIVENGDLSVDGSTNEIKARNIGISVNGGRAEINGGTINGARTGMEYRAGLLDVKGGTMKNCTTGIYQMKGTPVLENGEYKAGLIIENVEICDCGAGIDVYKGECIIYRGNIKRCSAGVVSRKESKINFKDPKELNKNQNSNNTEGEKSVKATFNINSCCIGIIIEERTQAEYKDTVAERPGTAGSNIIQIDEGANVSMKNYMSGVEIYYLDGKKFNPGSTGGRITFNKYLDINGQQKGCDYIIILKDSEKNLETDIDNYYGVKEANVYFRYMKA